MELMKSFFIFLIFYCCAVSVGLAITKQFSLPFKKYFFPVGFIILFGGYELIMFFPLYLNLSNLFSYLAASILLALIIWSFLYNKKDIVTEFFERKNLLLIGILLLTFGAIHLFGYVGDFRLDHNFYISYIQENMVSNTLNYLNMLQSGYSTMTAIYSQDGFYHLLALIAKVFHQEGYFFAIGFTPFLYTIFASTVLFESIEQLTNRKFNRIIFTICALVLVFNPHLIVNTMMGNLYRDYVLIFVLLFLFKKELSKNEALFLFVVFLAGISVHSTFVFLGIIVIVAKFIHLLLTHADKIQVKWFAIYSSSLFLNACLLFLPKLLSVSKGLLATLASVMSLIFLFTIVTCWKMKYFEKGCKVFLMLSVVVLYCGSLYLTYTKRAVFDYTDFFYEVFLFNASMVEVVSNIHLVFGYVITLVFLVLNRKNRTYLDYLLAVTWFVFYNPITIAAISTYLTYVVYFRIAFLFINFFICFMIINQLKNKFFFVLLCGMMLLTFCLPYSYGLKFKHPGDYNADYRMENDAVHAFELLNELGSDYQKSNASLANVFSTDFRAPYLTTSVHYSYTIYSWRGAFREKQLYTNDQLTVLYKAFAYSRIYDVPQTDLMEIIQTKSIDFILLDTYQTVGTYEKLNSICKLVYENPSFKLYRCSP